MKHPSLLALSMFALCLAIAQPSRLSGQRDGGWTSLFDGKTLDGWNMIGTANWQVVDGVIEASKGTGYLVTPASYGDFQITLEFWVSEDANSGVFLRCSDPKIISATNAYEVNIYDK